MKRLLYAAIALAILANYALAQNEPLLVTIVLPDGTEAPFQIDQSDGVFDAWYDDGATNGRSEDFLVTGGDGVQGVPLGLIARADLVDPGAETIWRFTLKDGRILDGAVRESDAHLTIGGVDQFGHDERLRSFPRRPDRQPVISVIFDESPAGQATSCSYYVLRALACSAGGESAQAAAHAEADTVNLRNGDVLRGDVLTTEFALQTSHGTSSFTKDQLSSVRIESQDGRTDQVVLDDGDPVSGVLQNETIEITLTSGATVTLEKGDIASITFAAE